MLNGMTSAKTRDGMPGTPRYEQKMGLNQNKLKHFVNEQFSLFNVVRIHNKAGAYPDQNCFVNW